MRKSNTDIPMSMMPDRQREEKSSIFGFTDSTTLVSYVPKKGKSVVLLSTMHSDNKICDDEEKTDIVTFYNSTKQGWARDVKARDRDAHLPRPRRDRDVWLHQTRRDRDETLKFRDETETRPRRDVCSSRDVIETLKYTSFIDCNYRPRCYLSRSLF